MRLDTDTADQAVLVSGLRMRSNLRLQILA